MAEEMLKDELHNYQQCLSPGIYQSLLCHFEYTIFSPLLNLHQLQHRCGRQGGEGRDARVVEGDAISRYLGRQDGCLGVAGARVKRP